MRVTSSTALGSPSLRSMVEQRFASRLADHDTSLFSFDPQAQVDATTLMDWTHLASDPVLAPEQLTALVERVGARDIDDIVLIGQGGSTQAAMVLTNLTRNDAIPKFHTLDTASPHPVETVMRAIDPLRTLFVVSSKSGGTLEPLCVYRCVREIVESELDAQTAGRRFIAITDPGSPLETLARDEGFLEVVSGVPGVGGRFSALSPFGLVPAVLVGANIEVLLARAAHMQRRCSSDGEDNPAIMLAAFLFDGLLSGRDKFSLITPQPGRVFGLWVEQLIAESLGKQGRGLVPHIEIDPSLLLHSPQDRTVVAVHSDDDEEFREAVLTIRTTLPTFEMIFDDYDDLGAAFVVWEYATALLAILIQVNPFDQPDVSETKKAVELVLSGALVTPPAHILGNGLRVDYGRVLRGQGDPENLAEAIAGLTSTITSQDYFALLSFVPFSGERRSPLEQIRRCVSSSYGIASCLEIGPRYLHSTGQLHKGGPDNGVYLILSADSPSDIDIPGRSCSLGELQNALSQADLAALSARGRRVLHVHLPCISGSVLQDFADLFCEITRKSASRCR